MCQFSGLTTRCPLRLNTSLRLGAAIRIIFLALAFLVSSCIATTGSRWIRLRLSGAPVSSTLGSLLRCRLWQEFSTESTLNMALHELMCRTSTCLIFRQAKALAGKRCSFPASSRNKKPKGPMYCYGGYFKGFLYGIYRGPFKGS